MGAQGELRFGASRGYRIHLRQSVPRHRRRPRPQRRDLPRSARHCGRNRPHPATQRRQLVSLRQPRMPRGRRLHLRREAPTRTRAPRTSRRRAQPVARWDWHRSRRQPGHSGSRPHPRPRAGRPSNALNPEAIIVGGELGTAGSPLLVGVRDSIDRYAQPAAAHGVTVRSADLGLALNSWVRSPLPSNTRTNWCSARFSTGHAKRPRTRGGVGSAKVRAIEPLRDPPPLPDGVTPLRLALPQAAGAQTRGSFDAGAHIRRLVPKANSCRMTSSPEQLGGLSDPREDRPCQRGHNELAERIMLPRLAHHPRPR